MKIDLHAHTHYSDGSFSPAQVVEMAIEKDVKVLAITDHDTTAGVNEAIEAAKSKDIKIIPGIEITCAIDCVQDYSIEIVGLGVDINSPDLIELCKEAAKIREIRNKIKLDAVNKHFNENITLGDMQKKTKGQPATPHIAMVLLDKGYVKTIKQGIYLMIEGGPCYVKRTIKSVHAKKAIETIHKAGGKAVLAHLAAYKNSSKFNTFKEQEELVKELAPYGLDAIEVYIPDITQEETDFELELVKKYNLKVTCGSDFHDEEHIPQNILGMFNLQDMPKDLFLDI